MSFTLISGDKYSLCSICENYQSYTIHTPPENSSEKQLTNLCKIFEKIEFLKGVDAKSAECIILLIRRKQVTKKKRQSKYMISTFFYFKKFS